MVVAARPDVFNHNLETVAANYLTVRPGARYFHSIRLLQQVKEIDPSMFTKSGIMVGLGETRNQVLQLMDDLRVADVDFLTIGQYLQPTKKHHKVMAYVTPEEFASYETAAYARRVRSCRPFLRPGASITARQTCSLLLLMWMPIRNSYRCAKRYPCVRGRSVTDAQFSLRT